MNYREIFGAPAILGSALAFELERFHSGAADADGFIETRARRPDPGRLCEANIRNGKRVKWDGGGWIRLRADHAEQRIGEDEVARWRYV